MLLGNKLVLENLCLARLKTNKAVNKEFNGKDVEFSLFDISVKEESGKKKFFIGVKISGSDNPLKNILIEDLYLRPIQISSIISAAMTRGIGIKSSDILK